jgi:hypothetical protein
VIDVKTNYLVAVCSLFGKAFQSVDEVVKDMLKYMVVFFDRRNRH